MRKVQITIELPDIVDSLDQLEALIDAKGQHIKQELFEHELAHLTAHEKQSSDSVACPHCKKKVSSERAANRDS
jgi:hypothetical protein